MRDLAVAVGDEDDDRRDRERDERELPAVHEEDGGDDDDRDDVLREEDEAVAEEEAHGLEVDRRPRHELAGLAAVVEAERQPQEVPVQLVAEVVLDGERLTPRDQASSEHERPAEEAEPDDRRDQEGQDRRVGVVGELVDDDAGEDGHEDARDLGPDREQRRDDERRAVRAEKREQADERAAPAGGRPCRLVFRPRHALVGYGSCPHGRCTGTVRTGAVRNTLSLPTTELRDRSTAVTDGAKRRRWPVPPLLQSSERCLRVARRRGNRSRGLRWR